MKLTVIQVPGAFTPGCQARHVTPYIENINDLAAKGVDLVVVIASNDSFVMAAWGKVNGMYLIASCVTLCTELITYCLGVDGNSKIKFMSDSKTMFSKQIGWMAGVGDRNGRYAMVIEKDGTISYAERETSPREVSVSLQELLSSCL